MVAGYINPLRTAHPGPEGREVGRTPGRQRGTGCAGLGISSAMGDSHSRPEPRSLIIGALGCWLVTASAAVWGLLAQQAPGSPYRVGVLPGPVEQLSGASFMLGTGLMLCALLWPRVFEPGTGRYWPWLSLTGAAACLLALAYAALHGVYGVQIDDPRPTSSGILALRALGHVLITAALLDLMVRYTRRSARTHGEAKRGAGTRAQ